MEALVYTLCKLACDVASLLLLVFRVACTIGGVWLLAVAVWNGLTIEIGNPASGFHLLYTLQPLRRFFK